MGKYRLVGSGDTSRVDVSSRPSIVRSFFLFFRGNSFSTLSRFGAYCDALAVDDSEQDLLHFAKQKLLNGKPILADGDGPGSLACLDARFTLEYKSDSISGGVVCTQVEHHMRLILAATTGFETLITITGSEPLLAEAASQLMRESLATPVHHLAYISDPDCIDHGRRGELVAALLVMQARDAASAVTGRRWVSVSDFMQALFPQFIYETLQRSMPRLWREGEDKSFDETFRDYAIWFNHVIRIEDSKMINSKSLWMFITRGAMIMSRHNQCGVDIVLPVCLTRGNLSRDTVTAILIQVKNIERFGHHIDETSFDELDPFRVGLFSDEQDPRPVIRMVLELGSTSSSVLFPTRTAREDEHLTRDRFTSFDIWCAGLSEDTYKAVGDDLASYQLLLRRSRRRHGTFNLDETHVGHDPDARNTREFARGRMAPLAECKPGNNAIYV